MLQYKIPQNVGIEDKIVGPLTMRQLIYIAVGIGASYVLFAILNKLYELNILEYIIIGLPALIAVALALVKINDIPLLRYILLFLEFSIKPKRRMWDHRGISALVDAYLESPASMMQNKPMDTKEIEKAQKIKKAKNLSDLSKILDSGGFDHVEDIKHEDIDEAEDDELVTNAYFANKPSKTENMYWRTADTHKKMLDIFAKMPITKITKGSKEAEILKEQIKKVKEEVESSQAQSTEPRNIGTLSQDDIRSTTPTLNQERQIQNDKQVNNPPSLPQELQKIKKKKRRPRRKLFRLVRNENNIDTTTKNKPAQYIPNPKSQNQKNITQNTNNRRDPSLTPKTGLQDNVKDIPDPKPGQSSMGEFRIEDLKGGDIEINLD